MTSAVLFGVVRERNAFEAAVVLQVTATSQNDGPIENVLQVVAAPPDRFLVVDPWAGNVRVYALDGQLLRTIGRRGQGPGEVSEGVQAAIVVGEQVYVPDVRQRRLSVFNLESGSFEDSYVLAIDPIVGIPLVWLGIDGGRIVAASSSMATSGNGGMQFVLSAFEDGHLQPLITRDVDSPGPGAIGSLPAVAGARTSNRIYLGDRTSGTIAVYDSAGNLEKMLEWAGAPPPPFTGSERRYLGRVVQDEQPERKQRRWEQAIARMPEAARARFRRALDSSMADRESPDTYPVFTDLRIDGAERIWVGRPMPIAAMQSGPYDLDWDDLRNVASDWDVFDDEGRYQGSVSMPYAFVVTDVANNTLFGYQIQEDGTRVVTLVRVPAALAERDPS